MKNTVIIAFLLLTTLINAQPPGDRRGRQPNRNSGEKQVRVFNASDIAGIFYYDVKEVIKKVKIKDAALKASVRKALKDYNSKIKEISFLNSENLKALNAFMKSNKDFRRNRNRNADFSDEKNEDSNKTSEKDEIREKINKVIRPIRKDIKDNEIILNEGLKSLLSEKQNKRWLKYQKQQKDKLKPKRQQRDINRRSQQQGQRGNRQRGGF